MPSSQSNWNDYAPLTTAERRVHLANWLLRENIAAPYTAMQIVDVSGIYDHCTNGRYDTCRRDLMRLDKNNVVVKVGGYPARWRIARA